MSRDHLFLASCRNLLCKFVIYLDYNAGYTSTYGDFLIIFKVIFIILIIF